jgi:NAD(P)-dependent dehydrogenase (short-subunit alcohol dehydrogenase family)
MERIKGKVAIVTGGALGIGKAACQLLAAEGGRVAVTDIKDDEGQEVAKAIKKSGGRADYWHLDVSIESDVKDVFIEIKERFGSIDILVNNAGISGANKPTHELTEEDWDRVMAVNIKGVFFCTKHAIPHMQQAGGGSIVNLSSIYGIISSQDVPPYHASKGAVRIMTKTDSLLYAKNKIRVNSIHPGFIWTPMVEHFAESQPGGVEEFRESLSDLHPIGRIGEPEDIAYGILYLASDEAKFVTGSELVIDGGYTAK